jgi:hypothetical protein
VRGPRGSERNPLAGARALEDLRQPAAQPRRAGTHAAVVPRGRRCRCPARGRSPRARCCSCPRSASGCSR